MTRGEMNGDSTVWRIEPGRGAGPLRIGMPVDAAVRALDAAGLGPVQRETKAAQPVYASRGWSVLIYPGDPSTAGPEVVHEIELSPPMDADLHDRTLMGMPLAGAEEFFRSIDERTERRYDLVEAPGLGVRAWSGGDPPDWPIASVSVHRPTAPGLVLDPAFTFTELDEAMRRAGFAGGPVTVRAPLLPGEPELAEWRHRHVLLRYSFDPVSMLRVLYLDGPEATGAPSVRKLVARLPQPGEARILADLAAPVDDVSCLRAIQAVSVLRLVAARDPLTRLVRTAPEPLRTAATRTLIGLPDVRID